MGAKYYSYLLVAEIEYQTHLTNLKYLVPALSAVNKLRTFVIISYE